MWTHIDTRPPLDDQTRLAWIRDLQRHERELRKTEKAADKLADKLKGGETDGRKSR